MGDNLRWTWVLKCIIKRVLLKTQKSKSIYAKDIDRVFANGWYSPFSNGVGYVDTGIKSSSRNPKVKGNW